MKNKLFVFLAAIVLALSCFVFIACDDEDNPPPPEVGSLTIADLTVNEGESADLDITFSNEEFASDITYSFSSNAFTIKDGAVTGVKATAQPVTVTATTPFHTATFKVTVNAVDYGVLSISVGDVYVNYPAVPITAEFSKPEHAMEISYSVSGVPSGLTVEIENGYIKATGSIAGSNEVNTATVKVNAVSANGKLKRYISVPIMQYNGKGLSSPLNFETRIKNFIADNEAYSGVNGGEKGGTLFVGDSFFDGYWSAGSFRTAYDRKNAYRFGVSSSTVTDWLVVSERLVIPMQPKNIVVHCGTNDYFDDGKSEHQITSMLKSLFNRYHEALPQTKVYWFSIEPRKTGTGAKREDGGVPDAVNAAIKAFAEQNSGWLTYIDSAAWCYTDDTRTQIKSSFYVDNVHPSAASYQLYVDALETAGLTLTDTAGITVTTIADYRCDEFSAISNSKRTLYYRTELLTNEYTLSGNIKISKVKMSTATAPANPHIELRFSASNRFLIWDSNTSNFEFGVGWQANGSHVNENTTGCSKFTFTPDTTLTLPFKLVVTAKNAYLYINGKLEAVAFNVPNLTSGLIIGAENAVVAVTDLIGARKGESGGAYETAIAASEIVECESVSGASGNALLGALPGAVKYAKYTAGGMGNFVTADDDFVLPGKKKNSTSAFTGTVRDWVYSQSGVTKFAGDFAFTFSVQLLDYDGTALQTATTFANNAFFMIGTAENSDAFAFNKSLIYWKKSSAAAVDITYGTSTILYDDITSAAAFKVTAVRKGNNLYLAYTIGSTVCKKQATLTDGSTLSIWMGGEDWNYRITDLTLSQQAAEVASALTAIGETA